MFVGPGELRFDEVDAPTIVQGTDALVRPIAATTCDLDHHVIQDKTPFSPFGPFPLGHECVGRVVEVGPDCTDVQVGDVVGVAWHIACGTCEECRRDHPARCLLHGDAQYGLPVNGLWGGTFSELIRVPYADYNLLKLPDTVNPVHLASIGDNLALGWETVMPTIAGMSEPGRSSLKPVEIAGVGDERRHHFGPRGEAEHRLESRVATRRALQVRQLAIQGSHHLESRRLQQFDHLARTMAGRGIALVEAQRTEIDPGATGTQQAGNLGGDLRAATVPQTLSYSQSNVLLVTTSGIAGSYNFAMTINLNPNPALRSLTALATSGESAK